MATIKSGLVRGTSVAKPGLKRGKFNPEELEFLYDETYSLFKQSPEEVREKVTKRAESPELKDQYRRKIRAKKAQNALHLLNEEATELRKPTPRVFKSPEYLRRLDARARGKVPGAAQEFRNAVQARLGTISRRQNLLKNLSKKAGVLGLFATPYTTGEALIGLGSKDPNERLKSVEVLQGLPDYSSGRGITEKEKKEKPIWYDPTTGEWKI